MAQRRQWQKMRNNCGSDVAMKIVDMRRIEKWMKMMSGRARLLAASARVAEKIQWTIEVQEKKNNVWFSQHSKRSKKRFRNEEEDAKLELTAAHKINSNRSLFECDDFAIISSKRCSDTNHHLLFSSNWEFRQRLPSFFCSRVASVSFFFFQFIKFKMMK